MKAFTALGSWLSEMWQFLNHRQNWSNSRCLGYDDILNSGYTFYGISRLAYHISYGVGSALLVLR